MRIICPTCDAQYDLPPAMAAKLPARTRCVRCGGEWEAMADAAAQDGPSLAKRDVAVPVTAVPVPAVPESAVSESAVSESAVSEPAVAAPRGTVVADRERPGVVRDDLAERRRVRTLWLGSIALVAVLVVVFVALHGPIGRAWPPSVRLYRALGVG